MPRITFPSIKEPEKKAYAFDTAYEYVPDKAGCFTEYVKQYDTYGDGLTQHSPDYHVRLEDSVDALYSMTKAMLENPEAFKTIAPNVWMPVPSRQQIEFFQKLVYNENKRVYYCQSDLKKSSAESKRYDRRWEEVPSWADGSFNAVLRFCNEFIGASWGLQRYAVWHTIREHFMETNEYVPWDGEPLPDDSETSCNAMTAFRAFYNLVRTYYMMEMSKSNLNNFVFQLEWTRKDKVSAE